MNLLRMITRLEIWLGQERAHHEHMVICVQLCDIHAKPRLGGMHLYPSSRENKEILEVLYSASLDNQ